MTTNETTQLTGLREMLADAERRLANVRPRDVAGEPVDRARASAQRRVDRLRAAIARVEAQALTPASREVVAVGWDGASQPMYRYRDELDRPDSARSIVAPEDRP